MTPALAFDLLLATPGVFDTELDVIGLTLAIAHLQGELASALTAAHLFLAPEPPEEE